MYWDVQTPETPSAPLPACHSSLMSSALHVLLVGRSAVLTCLNGASWQTGEDWSIVVGAKARGAYNLDRACQHVATLDHFVMFSSLVSTVGNEGASGPAKTGLLLMGRMAYSTCCMFPTAKL